MVNHILAQPDLPQFAERLAATLQPGDALLLDGPLGAGKTALSRALIRALTNDPALEVQSPTFPICLTYDTDGPTIWHYDLYRLNENADLSDLGWDEVRRDGIAIVEWPERARADQMHKPFIRLSIAFTDEEGVRNVTIEDVR